MEARALREALTHLPTIVIPRGCWDTSLPCKRDPTQITSYIESLMLSLSFPTSRIRQKPRNKRCTHMAEPLFFSSSTVPQHRQSSQTKGWPLCPGLRILPLGEDATCVGHCYQCCPSRVREATVAPPKVLRSASLHHTALQTCSLAGAGRARSGS